MTPFEYVAGIYSIVLGLAVANLLSALASTLKYRGEIRHYWVHSAWCGTLLFSCLAAWWGLWQALHTSAHFALLEFLLSLQLAVFYYVASALLKPDPGTSMAADLEAAFYIVRVPFFVCILAPGLIFVPFSWWLLGYFDPALVGSIVVLTPLAIAGMVTVNRRAHGAIVCIWLAVAVTQEALQAAVGV